VSKHGFTFFEKPQEIKKKAKTKCAWCGEETGNISKHLKTCEKYLEEKLKTPKVDNFQDKVQKQIEDLNQKNQELTSLILKTRETLIKEESPVIKALLQDIKARNIDDITEELMKITGLDKYDYYEGGDHYCANMDRIKKVVDPKKDPQNYKLARFINRIYKGDRAMYRVVVNYLNQRDQKIIDKYQI
jgi:hypothetical protein